MIAVEKKTLVSRLRELPGPKGQKKVDHNTYAFRDADGTIRVRLHETDIIKVSPTGVITVTSGGWQTTTTKDRLNNNLGHFARVSQNKGLWYIQQQGQPEQLFEDGMILGRKIKPKSDAKVLKLRKKVRQFAKDFIAKLQAGEMDAPGPGDCFLCGIFAGERATFEPGNADHILSHMEEKYYVPRLLYNALTTMPSSPAMKGLVDATWHHKESCFDRDFVWQDIEKCLYRYIYRQLGLPT